MNYIKWVQLGSCGFISEDKQFTIHLVGEAKWRLDAKIKGKFYNFTSLDGAFKGARNIADFARKDNVILGVTQ